MSGQLAPWGARAARLARRVRSLGRRRLLLRGGLLLAVLAVGALGLALTVPPLYADFGSHPERDAAAWAALTPQYASSTACRACHDAENAKATTGAHVGLDCETCHGPAAAHAAAASPATVAVSEPTTAICTTCHQVTEGRPARVGQVDLATHYPGYSCLMCHDPHSASAATPPVVDHPIAGLPSCLVCHATDAFKPMPSGHPVVADAICLTCHVPETAAGKPQP